MSLTCDYYVQDVRTMTTGELAKELHVSRGAIIKWQRAGLIHPEFTTPGGHHRWDPDKVREELRQLSEQANRNTDERRPR